MGGSSPNAIEVPGYALEAELGRGAMGIVYAARHLETDEPVALKIVQSLEGSELDSEIAAMAKLNHPRLLYLYDFGTVDHAGRSHTWMALERASGGTLEDWVPNTWKPVAAVFVQTLEGLAHAHARGLIHRDVKPANLLRATAEDRRPGLKIADFGISWVLGQERGRRAGTPFFMPPEQTRRGYGRPGAGSDLYSLAAMIWWWTTGAPLYDEGEALATALAHCDQSLPAYEPIFDVPWRVGTLLAWMLEKRPEERPRNVAEVMRVLRPQGWSGQLPSRPPDRDSAPTAPLPGIGAGMLGIRQPSTVGRHPEREELWSLLVEVAAAKAPRLALITGPAGLGKRHLIRWLTSSALEHGTVVVLEDPDVERLHAETRSAAVIAWCAGGGTQASAMFERLAFSGVGVLAVACVVAREDVPNVGLFESVREIRLAPLDGVAFRELMHDGLGVGSALALQLQARCGGNPGLAIQWVVDLARRGELQPSAAGFELDRVLPRLPPGLDAGLSPGAEKVIAGFSEEETLSLQVGAILGMTVEHALWKRTHQILGARVRPQGLRALARLGLVLPAGEGWAFADAALRSRALRDARLRVLHRAAAAAIAELPAGIGRDLAMVRHRLGATDVAGAREVVLSLIGTSIDDPVVGGIADAALEVLEGANPNEACRLLGFRMQVIQKFQAANGALTAAMDVERASRADGVTQQTRASVLASVSMIYALNGLSQEALDILLGLPPTHLTRSTRAMALSTLGRHQEAMDLYRVLYKEAASAYEGSRSANGLATILALNGRLEEALVWFHRVAKADPRSGYVAFSNLCHVNLLLGRDEVALTQARTARELSRGVGRIAQGKTVLLLAIVAALQEDTDTLAAVQDHGHHVARRWGLEHLDSIRLRIAEGGSRPGISGAFLRSIEGLFDD